MDATDVASRAHVSSAIDGYVSAQGLVVSKGLMGSFSFLKIIGLDKSLSNKPAQRAV